jgi:hypothetical protein
MIELALYLDLLAVGLCLALLLRFGKLSHSHPATIYLFFHIYTVTSRLIAISMGSPTLFSGWGMPFLAVTLNEIARASFLADSALLVMTAAWLRISYVESKRNDSVSNESSNYYSSLSLMHIWRVVSVALPVGIAGLVLIARWPGIHNSGKINDSTLATSSWVSITQTWAGISLLALIYWYGFRWMLVLPMSVYLTIFLFQGYHRFRVIIPIILMMQIYLDRRRRRWPALGGVLLLLVLFTLFYPLKQIGRMVQEGASYSEVFASASTTIRSAYVGQAADQQFLDQYAAALTLIDENGQFNYGQSYLPLITLPIPRQLWPGKPGLADYIGEFSTPWRPMKQMGMIVTFLGEAYANYGYFGIVIIPYLLAYSLGRAYFLAYKRQYFSIERFTYLLFACNLLQVFRDGISSLVVFTFVNMMPLALIVILHYLAPLRNTDDLILDTDTSSYAK